MPGPADFPLLVPGVSHRWELQVTQRWDFFGTHDASAHLNPGPGMDSFLNERKTLFFGRLAFADRDVG
jgi:hypothetical protein